MDCVKVSCKSVLSAILKDSMAYIGDYCLVGIFIGIMFSCLYCFFVFASKRYYHTVRSNIVVARFKFPSVFLLGFYLYLIFGITILSREKGSTYIIRPVPFTTWGTDLWHLTLWMENILMMIPLGILLYILWMPFRKIKWMLIAGFLISLLIECIQLITRLGKFETDDIINNVIGTWIGFVICKVLDKARIAFANRISMKL